MNRKIGIVGLFLALFIVASGCGVREYSHSFFAMNTYMSFTVYGAASEDIVYNAQKEIDKLEKLWSVTDENSDVYKINHSDGSAVSVNRQTAELMDFALEMSEKTGGCLDPTIYPVLRAWGFTASEYRIPDDKEILRLLNNTGCEKIHISGNSITAEKGVMVDFGAVAKGYAGDIITDYLRSEGVSSALLDIGGNIQAIGTKPDGNGWKIGLRSPFSDGILGVLEIKDIAVVTSGNYERFFIGVDGKKYGHIIDPKTGCPVDNGLASITVIGKEGKVCDALSTALFVMGYDGAVEYYHSIGGFEMIIVSENGDIHITSGAADMFTPDEGGKVYVIE